jgi:hypothetical protein
MSGELEERRDLLLQSIADLYAHGEYSGDEMEALTGRAANARSTAELETVVRELPAEVSRQLLSTDRLPGAGQAIVARSGSVRRKGRWLQSRDVRVTGASSSYRLDLSEYQDLRGATLRLDLDVASCSVRITLPACFTVRDEISDNLSSVVRMKLRPMVELPTNTLVLSGRIKSSSVRIKQRRR